MEFLEPLNQQPLAYRRTSEETTTLEQIVHSVGQHLPETMILNAIDARTWRDELARSLAFEIRFAIYGKDMKSKCVCYPKTWWDHFKERWFPRWLALRFPVERTTVILSAQELYPELSLPNHKPVIHIRKETI